MCSTQAQKVLGVQVESALMEAVEKSDSLLRFGLFFQSPNARLRIQDKLKTNLDLRMSTPSLLLYPPESVVHFISVQ